MSQRRKLNNALSPPHLLQFIPMLSKPFFNQSLRRQRKIAIGHFKRRQIKHSYAIAVNSMNMRRFMFFRLKEHTSLRCHRILQLLAFYTIPFSRTLTCISDYFSSPFHAGNPAPGIAAVSPAPQPNARIIPKPPRPNQARRRESGYESAKISTLNSTYSLHIGQIAYRQSQCPMNVSSQLQ